MRSHRFSVALCQLSLPLFMASCASKPEYYEPIPVTMNSTDEIDNLKAQIEAARADQTPVLAPKLFNKAIEAREEAEKRRADNRDPEKILDSVARGRAYLKKANEISNVAKAGMESVLKARGDALTAKANELEKKDFSEAEEELTAVTQRIEKGRLDLSADDKAGLEKNYREVELKAILRGQIGEAEKNIETAKDEGAKRRSPHILASAEEKYEEAKKLIEKDRYNTEAISAAAAAANKEAATLLLITRQAKVTAEKTPEELAMERHQAELQLQSLQAQTSQQQAVALSQGEALKGLQGQAAIDNKVAEVRKQFQPDEADILKDGNNVVIRLKKVAFKSNQSALETQQVQVLAKLKMALDTFDAKKIVIEGHTDSVGAKQKNLSLSEERAKLVEHYLEANGAIDPSKVEAVGYGYEKPLASNKTSAGRAQNRRVDVVIEL